MIFQERKSIVKRKHSLVDRFGTKTHEFLHQKFLEQWQDDDRMRDYFSRWALCIVFFQFFCFASKHYSELLSSSFSSRGDPPFSSPALSALASKISMLLLKHLRPPSSIQSYLYHVEQCSIHLYWLFFINNCFSILFLTSASAFFFGLPRPFPL